MLDEDFGADVVFDLDLDLDFEGHGLYDGYSGVLVDDGLVTFELVIELVYRTYKYRYKKLNARTLRLTYETTDVLIELDE
jgi:hypothetical protein